jgi:5-oxoprolinase (ATP-hydrolysing)
MPHPAWRIGVDVGGTFADAVAVSPDGEVRRVKLFTDGRWRLACEPAGGALRAVAVPAWAVGALAGCSATGPDGCRRAVRTAMVDGGGAIVTLDPPPAVVPAWIDVDAACEAPVLSAHLACGVPPGATLPAIELRVGTTRGTNALLEGRIDRVAAFVDDGLEGLLEIGTQQRLGLFDVVPQVPPRIAAMTFGVPGRLAADGSRATPFDPERVRDAARAARDAGCIAAAVALIHAWRDPAHERQVAGILREEGFARVSLASEVSAAPRLLARAQTAAVDAALGGAVRGMLERVARGAGTALVHAAASDGGVVPLEEFGAKDSLLSGPAMGCAAAAVAAGADGCLPAISFDMGGTSTDVGRIDARGIDLRSGTVLAGLEIAVPSVDVVSVAAGGGSICTATTEGLFVGPASAGADPGPACFGRGGPLTLTDVNLLLGLLPDVLTSVPLDREASRRCADAQAARCGRPVGDMLRAFRALANEHMAAAVRTVTSLRGHDPACHALVAFGGAGGQHACAVAAALGMRRVLVPAHAGFVSGLGACDAAVQRAAVRAVRAPLGDGRALHAAIAALRACAGTPAGMSAGGTCRIDAIVRLDGLSGSFEVGVVPDGTAADAAAACADGLGRRHLAVFGRPAPDRPIIVDAVRMVAGTAPPGAPRTPVARRVTRDGAFTAWAGEPVTGPNVLAEPGATVVVEDGWTARLRPSGALLLEHVGGAASEGLAPEVVAARCVSIAEWMSATLQRTARSPNVRDRLDYSCGLLDARGTLCANAPNVPVHLGALGACVRAVEAVHPLRAGEAVLVNHPAFGGSHLPDLTVILPVCDEAGRRVGIVAARAHHAEVGGTRPGSMPPDARTLEDEGVAIAPMAAARDGVLDEAAVRAALAAARHPSRDPQLNVDDLRAMVSALEAGAAEVRALASAIGADALAEAFESLLFRSAARTAAVARTVPDRGLAREDALDDGTPIRVRIERRGDRLRIDFTGSGGVHPGNLNAPLAVTRSAVLYALRVLAGRVEPLDEHRAPLNEGFLRGVDLVVPEGILNPPFEADPARCPAVFAGNTETSQRVAEAVLGAFGAVADGQGTMNSVSIAGDGFATYETLGGGAGACGSRGGTDAVHVHMTNTRLGDAEVLESSAPLRVAALRVRRGSGGAGGHRGGDGLERAFLALAPCTVSVAAQRRVRAPRGACGGGDGQPGRQQVERADGTTVAIPGDGSAALSAGDVFRIETPGGGGFGAG